MKGFIEELKKAYTYVDEDTIDPESQKRFFDLYVKYSAAIGRRAVYRAGRGEARIVVIEKVTPAFVILVYKYYGMNYSGVIRTCTNYNSLMCGDDKLEVS